MRVYLAMDAAALTEAVRTGRVAAHLPVHAVTSQRRREATAGASGPGSGGAGAGGAELDDEEDLELEALLDAARSSLVLLAAGLEHGGGTGAPRRVVLAAEVPAGSVVPSPSTEPQGGSLVRLDGALARGVALAAVVSAHVDDGAAVVDVAAAARALADDPDGSDDLDEPDDGSGAPSAATGATTEDATGAAQERREAAVEAAEEHDLLWYGASEIAALAAELGAATAAAPPG